MTISDRCLSLCQPSYVQQLAINTMSSPSSSSSTTTTSVVGGRSSSCSIITYKSIVIMRLLLIACVTFIITVSLPIASAQEIDASTEPADVNTIGSAESSSQVCNTNEIFDGKICKCAPGYFMQSDKESRLRCEDECEEVYSSFFTYGACVSDIYGRLPKNAQPQCNMRCGVRIHTLTSIGIFLTFAAAIATLIFTLPVCITTCVSCLSARKASKTAKRVFIETQNQPYKDQQLQTLPYNPYVYWPYYGRT